jgi:3-dehydroquinate synthase
VVAGPGAGATVTVAHALGSYPVYIEPGVLSRLDALVARHLPDRRIAVIADAAVAELYGHAASSHELFTFPPGELSKSRECWARLTDALLDHGFGRDSAIVALGGGVAGDLAGFVAATYLRGVPYVQVPTTLLAMVDASVGGKTGIDTPHGKNLIGAFHPPATVVADPLTLGTLAERDYHSGLAEAAKHGLIADAEYFGWLAREAPAIARRDPAVLVRLVRRSVEIKAEVVSADERESGRRAILNAGHTVAHALEHVSGYTLPHGEAVALGLVAECALAERLGVAAAGTTAQVTELLTALKLPVRLASPPAAGPLLAAMAADKKNRRATLRFALPASVGVMHPGERWTTAAPAHEVRAALGAITP